MAPVARVPPVVPVPFSFSFGVRVGEDLYIAGPASEFGSRVFARYEGGFDVEFCRLEPELGLFEELRCAWRSVGYGVEFLDAVS